MPDPNPIEAVAEELEDATLVALADFLPADRARVLDELARLLRQRADAALCDAGLHSPAGRSS